MAKGIIVVDLPKSCRNIRGDENGCPFCGMVCQVKQKDVMKHVENGTKPDWCPIKSLEDMKDNKDYTLLATEHFRKGWNECIDEIEGM